MMYRVNLSVLFIFSILLSVNSSYAQFYEKVTPYSDYYCVTTTTGAHGIALKTVKGKYRKQRQNVAIRSQKKKLAERRNQKTLLNQFSQALIQHTFDRKKDQTLAALISNFQQYYTEGVSSLPEVVTILSNIRESGIHTDQDRQIAIENLQKLNDIDILGVRREIKALKKCLLGKIVPTIEVAGKLYAIKSKQKGNFAIASAIKLLSPFPAKDKNRFTKSIDLCVKPTNSKSSFRLTFSYNPCLYTPYEKITYCSEALEVEADQIATYDIHIRHTGVATDTEADVREGIRKSLIEASDKYLTSYLVRPLKNVDESCESF